MKTRSQEWLIQNYQDNERKAHLHRRYLSRNSMQFLSRLSDIKFQTGSKLWRYRGEKTALKSQVFCTSDIAQQKSPV